MKQQVADSKKRSCKEGPYRPLVPRPHVCAKERKPGMQTKLLAGQLGWQQQWIMGGHVQATPTDHTLNAMCVCATDDCLASSVLKTQVQFNRVYISCSIMRSCSHASSILVSLPCVVYISATSLLTLVQGILLVSCHTQHGCVTFTRGMHNPPENQKCDIITVT